MKKIREKMLKLLVELLTPCYSQEQVRVINALKSAIRYFFEGFEYEFADQINDVYLPVSKLEITDLRFEFVEKEVVFTIVLGRPGLLIGRSGRTIDALKEYLSSVAKHFKYDVNIDVKESKLWETISL